MLKRKKLELTKREKQVLILTCKEKRLAQIAEILKVTESTVVFHKKNIYIKTKAKSAIGLFKYAVIKKLFLFKGLK